MTEPGRPVLRKTLRLRDLLYQVLAHPIGLVVTTNDTKRAQSVLRKQCSADPALSRIQIRLSPFAPNELVLSKAAPRAPVGSAEELGL